MLAGVVLGIAQSCKFTLLIFYPTWCVLWLCFVLRRRWIGEKRPGLGTSIGQLGAIFAASLLVINLSYEFSGTGKQLKEFHFVSESLAGPKEQWQGRHYFNRFEGKLLGELILPVPAAMISGIDVQRLGVELNRQRSKFIETTLKVGNFVFEFFDLALLVFWFFRMGDAESGQSAKSESNKWRTVHK